MIKTFCDFCKKEIHHSNDEVDCNLKIIIDFESQLENRFTICRDCKKELLDQAQSFIKYVNKKKNS